MNFLLSLALTIGALSVTCQAMGRSPVAAEPTALDSAKSGKALYEEKCKTVAGEKIYKTVDNVEGIVLLKIRPQASDREWADRMWPGAAFALEAGENAYIDTFLGYEVETLEPFTKKPIPITAKRRGIITTTNRPNAIPGYRYVDVIDAKDGKRYRYTLIRKPRPTSKIGWIDTLLDKTPVNSPAPRYGVTFEDHVIPEERAVGVASSTIKVIDLKTNEVLGEMTRYAWSPGGPSRVNPSPWLTAHKCPSQAVGAEAATRKFVDQILIPRKAQ